MAKTAINYFAEVSEPAEKVIRQLKGNHRRLWLNKTINEEGLESVPEDLRRHELPEYLKEGLAQIGGPQARGGEDLPDLEQDEVEVARMTLTTSVHGEVVSLRARWEKAGHLICFRLVGEYDQDIDIPHETCEVALTPEQVIDCFVDADPNQNPSNCGVKFDSRFYPQLNEIYHGTLGAHEASDTENDMELSKLVDIARGHKLDEKVVFAAEQGDAGSQLRLGLCYVEGRGVIRDAKVGATWFGKAAEHGDVEAEYNLATCYRTGTGVTRDPVEAVAWYRKAAEKGYADAQYNLATCYRTGTGVTRDLVEAVAWYRQAAEQGDGVAQDALRDLGESAATDLR